MTMVGTNPKLHKAIIDPLEPGDHPYIDISELLDNEDTYKYQSLISSFQWNIYLGRFDICIQVITMSGFISAPLQVHMDRVKRIYAYLYKIRNVCIWLWTKEHTYSVLTDPKFDWE